MGDVATTSPCHQNLRTKTSCAIQGQNTRTRAPCMDGGEQAGCTSSDDENVRRCHLIQGNRVIRIRDQSDGWASKAGTRRSMVSMRTLTALTTPFLSMRIVWGVRVTPNNSTTGLCQTNPS